MDTPWKPSVTVAAIVENDGRYLLVEEQTSFGVQFNQPAGHLEPGESIVAAVVREMLEETARVFTPSGLLGVYLAQSPSTFDGTITSYLRFAFTGEAGPRMIERPLDTGIVDTVWMTIDEVRASTVRHRSPLVLRCIEDHHAGRTPAPLETLVTHASALANSL